MTPEQEQFQKIINGATGSFVEAIIPALRSIASDFEKQIEEHMTERNLSEIKVFQVPIEKIREYENNPRKNDGAVEAIAKSIRKYGFRQPCVVDKDLILIVGHTRFKAAQSLGLKSIPCVDGSDMTEEEVREYRLLDNKLNELSDWDFDKLEYELAEMPDFDFGSFGVDFDRPASEEDEGEEQELVDQDSPPAPLNPVARAGDVWTLGRHLIYCGDASLASLPIDLTGCMVMLTDPPYSSGAFQDAGKALSSSIGSPNAPKISRDNLSTRGYVALIKQVLANFPGEIAYAFTDWRMWCWTFEALESSGFAMRNMLVWDKLTPGMGAVWRAQHELIAFAHRSSDKLGWGKRGNVLSFKRSGNEHHPTQKPVEVLAQILNNSELGKVYDPFLGSGSTLIAAEQCERDCVGVELMPSFVDVAIMRWQALTGKQALLSLGLSVGLNKGTAQLTFDDAKEQRESETRDA